jgi:hypothetical protein
VSDTAPSRSEYASPSRFWRFVSIVGLFLLAWPPICGVAVWATKFSSATPSLGWIAVSVIYAYLFCAPSALLAGIIHAFAAIRFRRNSILVPFASAAAAAILGVAVIALPVSLRGQADVMMMNGLVFVLPLSLAASLICWRLTRRLARME